MNDSYAYEEAIIAYYKFVNKGKILGISLTRTEELKKFSDEQNSLLAYNNSHLGLQNIPISKIVGSVQKTEDFKKNFVPKNNVVKIRWCNIYTAMLSDSTIPPIQLYKIRDNYYVYDGNHRVSVANYLNFSSIEAEVTEFFSGKDTKEDLKYQHQFIFLKQTQLEIDLTETKDYKKIIKDIENIDKQKSILENAHFWNLQIYIPIIEILKFNNLIEPDELDGDAYIKFLEHRSYLINNTKKYDYTYALIDYMNMRYLHIKYTIKTQIKINYSTDFYIKKLYKYDKERSMGTLQKKYLLDIRELIGGSFIDEFYFSKVIKQDIKSWYDKTFEPTLEFFLQKSKNFENIDLIITDKLKLYRELKDYIDYYINNNSSSSMKEAILDYIIEIFIPILNYLSLKKLTNEDFSTQYFKYSHRKIKFLKNNKNICLEELDSLYIDISHESSTIQEILSKRLSKEKAFKGDTLKSVRELLLIKGQDVESFNEIVDLYQGTTDYDTAIILKNEIWRFIEKDIRANWVYEELAPNLDKLIQNEEGLKFFKTEQFMNFIVEKSNTYTLIDFYADIISCRKNKEIDIDVLLVRYINK